MVRGVVLKLEYEGLHIVCFACGRYGHKQDSCPKLQETASVREEQGGGSSEVACKEKAPTSHPVELTSNGTAAISILHVESALEGTGSCKRQIESDRYNWLIVKKVNRYKVATNAKGHGQVDRGQSPKSATTKQVHTTKALGSRYSLLTEGTEPIETEEDFISNVGPNTNEGIGASSGGPGDVVLGQRKKVQTSKVRNKNGRKIPNPRI